MAVIYSATTTTSNAFVPLNSLDTTNIVDINVGDDWQTKLAANPTATTFRIKSGTHTAQSLNLVATTNDNLTFIGEAGAVMDGNMTKRTVSASITNGSSTLTSSALFTAADFSATTPTMVSGPIGWNNAGTAMITAFNSTSSVTMGDTARATYGPVTVTLTRPPAANTWAAFYGTAKNITIRNLEIKNYATMIGRAAVHPMNGDDSLDLGTNWTIEYCNIHDNVYLNARFCHIATYRYNKINYGGNIGIGGGGISTEFTHNEVAYNNAYGNLVGFDSGGVKCAGYAVGAQITYNHVHDNNGIGIWTDVDNLGSLIEGNVVYNNTQGGIIDETCYGTKILRNLVYSNGPTGTSDFYTAGNILVSSGSNVEVAYNKVGKAGTSNQYNGIGILAQDRVKVGATSRTVTATLTNGSTTITLTSGAFTTADQGGYVNATGITSYTKWIASLTSATVGTLSTAYSGTTGSYSTTIETAASNYGNTGSGQSPQRQRAYNINVHDNDIIVAGTVPAVGMVTDVYDGFTFFQNRNIRFWGNTYVTVPGASVFLWNGGARTFAQWQAYGLDPVVSVSTPTTAMSGYTLPGMETIFADDPSGAQNSLAALAVQPIPFWVASTAYQQAYTLNVKVRPANPNGYIYACTANGTSGASAPTWGTTVYGTTTDNTVTWTNVGPDPSAVSGSISVDFSKSNSVVSYPTANITAYTAINLPPPGEIVWWEIQQGTTGYTMASPSSVFKFAGGAAAAAPAANKRLIYSFRSDGTYLWEISRSVAVG